VEEVGGSGGVREREKEKESGPKRQNCRFSFFILDHPHSLTDFKKGKESRSSVGLQGTFPPFSPSLLEGGKKKEEEEEEEKENVDADLILWLSSFLLFSLLSFSTLTSECALPSACHFGPCLGLMSPCHLFNLF